MIKRLFVLLFIATLLSQATSHAWVTRKNFEKVLDTWMNHDADDLVPSWGAPGNVYTLSSGGKVLTYIINTGSGGSVVPIAGTYMVFNRQWQCKVNFTVDSSNTLVRWSYEGNNCRSKAPKETINRSTKSTKKIEEQHSDLVRCSADGKICF